MRKGKRVNPISVTEEDLIEDNEVCRRWKKLFDGLLKVR